MKNICIFASSSQKLEQVYYDEASILGELMGKNGFNVVYGGSRLGMMYACASKVKENGGKIFGVMPQKLYDLGFGNSEDCDEFIITNGMRERKAKMDEISDGVIALAGGFGTLEEISEMIVQKQLGYNSKPVILLNTAGFYNGLVTFFDTIMERKFAKYENKKLYYIAKTPKDAINYIKSYNPQLTEFTGKF